MPIQVNAEKKGLICTKRKWCRRMEERLAPEANARAKGFVQLTITELSAAGKARRKGVMYKTSPSDRGFVLNFCPFCGTNLYVLFEITLSDRLSVLPAE
jgi:hypothetical protein